MKMELESSLMLFSSSTERKVVLTKAYYDHSLSLWLHNNIVDHLVKQQFAYVDKTANYTFIFDHGFDDNDIFPGECASYTA